VSDEDLEWDLTIDADTSGGTRLDSMLGRLESQLEQTNRQLVRMELGSHKAGAAHAEQGRHAEVLRGSFDRLIHQGMEPFLHKAKEIAEFEFIREGTERLLELPARLAEGVLHLGEEMIMAAAKAERFDAAFGNALGKQEGGEVLDYIDRIGKHTEFTRDQMKGMSLELAKAGYKGSDLGRGIEAMLDLGAMSANPVEGAQRAMSALERLKTTGKLEARALVPFGISEQALLGEVGKESGMSSKGGTSSTGAKVASQVQKAMEAGRIPIETELNSLYTLITEKTGKALGGAGADMETLLETKLTHLKELPELYFEKLRGTKGYERLSDEVGKLLDGLDPESPRGKRIFSDLELVFNHLADIMSGFDLAGVIEAGIDALDLFATEFVDLLSMLPGATGKHAGEVAAHMKERRMAEARKRGQDQADEEAAAAKNKADAEFYSTFPAGERVAAAKKGMYNPADDETPWLFKGIDASKDKFEDAGAGAGEAIEAGARKALRSHSPSQAFADIGRDAAAGFSDGIDDSADQVEQAINQMATTPMLGRPSAGAPTIVLQISPQIYIQGGGADANEIAQEVTDRLVEIVPGAVQSALEQIAMQGGPSS
jgi:hypothetical protein